MDENLNQILGSVAGIAVLPLLAERVWHYVQVPDQEAELEAAREKFQEGGSGSSLYNSVRFLATSRIAELTGSNRIMGITRGVDTIAEEEYLTRMHDPEYAHLPASDWPIFRDIERTAAVLDLHKYLRSQSVKQRIADKGGANFLITATLKGITVGLATYVALNSIKPAVFGGVVAAGSHFRQVMQPENQRGKDLYQRVLLEADIMPTL